MHLTFKQIRTLAHLLALAIALLGLVLGFTSYDAGNMDNFKVACACMVIGAVVAVVTALIGVEDHGSVLG